MSEAAPQEGRASVPAEYFEQMFADNDDPWAFRTRWYEQRKRDLTMAALPRQRYERIFEPACANGELSVLLAERSESMLCMDLSSEAVRLATERLRDFAGVEVMQGRLPGDWPGGEFDLIVLSEVAYYLSPADLSTLIDRAVASLSPGGALLACHWLHPIEGCPQDGRQVHAMLDAQLPLHRAVRHEEADFLLEFWCVQPCAIDLDEAAL
jgi:SAM-dependent methyltransferase